MAEPPAKRRRLQDMEEENGESSRTPASLTRAISPPYQKNQSPASRPILLPSPFRLTTIKGLPPDSNADTVSLSDLLGDPLIAECWEFNYLHDIDFLMARLDEDVRSLVKMHLIHGFWKREDPNRLFLEGQAKQYANVSLHTAYMPEMFGTHHSKMLILFRHDDTAQIIIHTANMIAKDWTNMTNGVWRSPLLPLNRHHDQGNPNIAKIGSGTKFKHDLLSYLQAYNTRRDVCKSLVNKLEKYDFSAVRAALIASVPGRHDVEQPEGTTLWGWQALKQSITSVPIQPGKPEIVVQVSSIATLGGTDAWLQQTLFNSLSCPPTSSFNKSHLSSWPSKPDFKIVFPTADEIRRSIEGYASGGSIHTRTQSAQQAKQLQYLRPIFCHWANDSENGKPVPQIPAPKNGRRKRAAPHIKTYIRYNANQSIDWALLTSANISKQAWGEATSKAGDVRVASWEIGVLVWPALLMDDSDATMVGVFGTDVPTREDVPRRLGDGAASEEDQPHKQVKVVGLRIPYSLPLQRYGDDEIPWVATSVYNEPDWKGNTWPGY
ncbi:phospholipase D/nuclease [Xylariaceae sp. FL0016]|nr:phospholipase D/nuclease [Xylariaceae sp. FL0016]